MVNEVVNTIMNQINWRMLKALGFKFVQLNEKTLRIHKGRKNFDIELDEGLDLYIVKKHLINRKDFSVKSEVKEAVFFDDLKPLIEDFFKLSKDVLRINKIELVVKWVVLLLNIKQLTKF